MIYVVSVRFSVNKEIDVNINIEDKDIVALLKRVGKIENKIVSIIGMKKYVIEATDFDEAKLKASEAFRNDVVKRCTEPITFEILSHHIEPYKIMSTDSNHSKSLVDKINYIYSHDKEAMKPIVGAMYFRDKEEADEKGISQDEFQNDFDEFLSDFLHRVCDDVDLETIINFVRYRNDNDEVLYADGWL